MRRVFLVTLGLNLLVAAAKGATSWLTGSLALGTDAIHSLLDGSSNVLALIGLHLSAAPAHPSLPYGRRKVEILAALGIGVLIVVGLFELAQAAAAALVHRRRGPDIGWAGLAVVLAAMAVDFGVARYEGRRAKELGSALLHADAKHTLSDFYADAAVLLSFAAVREGLGWADGVGALVLIVLVGRVAWSVFRDNVPILLDAAVLDPSGVAALAGSVEGVENVHRIRSRGPHGAVHLDLHMQVRPDMEVRTAHDLAHRIEQELRARYPEVSDVVIHIEPAGKLPAERPR